MVFIDHAERVGYTAFEAFDAHEPGAFFDPEIVRRKARSEADDEGAPE